MMNRRTICKASVAGLITHWPVTRSLTAEPQPRRVFSVTLLYTNDFHGRYMPLHVGPGNATSQTGDGGRAWVEFEKEGEIGGFARLAAAVKRVRRERGEQNVLLLHGGDTFSDDLLANLTEGEAVIDMMNALGYDFVALGNHDFDYGWKRTRELQDRARFPMRAANVLLQETGECFLGQPYQIAEAGGVKVALLALGYPNTAWTASSIHIDGLLFTSGIEAARRIVPQLRGQSDIVVIVSHQGTTMDEILAREVPGVDLILAAHSHDWLQPPRRVNSVPIVQALSDATILADIVLRIGSDGSVAVERAVTEPLWADRVEPDPEMQERIARWRQPCASRLEEIVGRTSARIGRQYASPSPFDFLVGQILMEEFDCDAALLPGIGYGVSLPEGDVKREQLYTLLPHPARATTVDLTGEQLMHVLRQSAFNQNPPQPHLKVGGIVQTPGLGWTIDLTEPLDRRVRHVSVAGRPLRDRRMYRIATISGMVDGLHRYDTISQGRNTQKTNQLVVDLVERHMGRKKVGPSDTGDCTLIPAGR